MMECDRANLTRESRMKFDDAPRPEDYLAEIAKNAKVYLFSPLRPPRSAVMYFWLSVMVKNLRVQLRLAALGIMQVNTDIKQQ